MFGLNHQNGYYGIMGASDAFIIYVHLVCLWSLLGFVNGKVPAIHVLTTCV